MKRNVTIAMIFLLLVGLAAIAPVYGDETGGDEASNRIASFDGLWVGSGKFRMSRSQYVGCPAGEEVLIAFYVRDGKAKSIFTHETMKFETEISQKGRIKFRYSGGTVDFGSGGTTSTTLDFNGKLEGASGGGRFALARCSGKWEVRKQNMTSARGVEFALYDDMILMLFNGEVTGALKPREGRRFTDVNASGDFLAVHASGEGRDGSTLLYRFEAPEKIFMLGALDGHLNFTKTPGFGEERGVDLVMREGKVYLYEGETLRETVVPEPGKTIEGFIACGSFLAVHEVDDEGENTTMVYYLKDNNFLSLVGIHRGKHTFF